MAKKAQSEDVKKYSKLLGKVEYDHEAAEQLAEAHNEVKALQQRVEQLKQIIVENKELSQFLWRTAEGNTLAIHQLEDSHFENIMLHLLRRGSAIPRAIRGEAMGRHLVIPVSVPTDWSDEIEITRRIEERSDNF